ncbi:hypothetical protein [Legionella waltersii]|uniref:Uncharacterized protein n=1 Tax=Legionella waltersii TaxID=66969 RepID=A0A0W1A2P4_9GAMM|nr:hypothetical protein [Legionella waltersii]KTD75615.1 hypothetical protein Lwal_2553 [Legionella waltersii]SNV03124.1 Uncharacterised protein [Legionella waltersii]
MPTPEEIIKELFIALNKKERYPINTPKQMIPSVMNRTVLAVDHHKDLIIEAHGRKWIHYQNQYYPIVSRDLRHFNQRVFSVGSSSSREILMLDPDSQPLKDAYTELRKKIKVGASTLETLQEIAKVTQKLFPDIETTHADIFVQKSLKMGNPFLSLSLFMQHGIGVCRQHALLNAYLMSRLVEDKLLDGEVIHQRHTFPEQGAHVWNLFRDAKDGKLYSLDSLWKHVVSLADNPGSLNQLYGLDVEKGIKDVFGEFRLPIKQNEPNKPTAQAMPSISPKSLDKLLEIENTPKNALIGDEFPEDGPDLVISPKAARAPIQIWDEDEYLNEYQIPVLSPKMGWDPKHFWVEDDEYHDDQALALSPKVENAPKYLLVENDEPDDLSIPNPSPKGKIEAEDGEIGFYKENEVAEDDRDLFLSPRAKSVKKRLWSDDEELEDYHDRPLSPREASSPKQVWVENEELNDNTFPVLSPRMAWDPERYWVEDDALDGNNALVLSPKVERVPKHLLINNDGPDDNFDNVLSPKTIPALYNPQDLLNDHLMLKLDPQKTTPIENNVGFFKKPSIKEQVRPNMDEEDSAEDDNLEIIRYLIKHGKYDNTEKIDDTELCLNKDKSFGSKG